LLGSTIMLATAFPSLLCHAQSILLAIMKVVSTYY
jgi:hypothetical protein